MAEYPAPPGGALVRRQCDNCGSPVDDEEFCPRCGAWVDSLRPTSPLPDETAPAADLPVEEFSLGEPPAYAEEGPRSWTSRPDVECSSCAALNPATNRHCEACGARLAQGALPVAPRPAVQATAGVRAAIATGVVLFVVVIVAVLFNIFTGGSPTETTLAPTETTAATSQTVQIDILDVNCTVPGIAGFDCSNLIDGGTGEYQITWDDVPAGETVSIGLVFAEPTVVKSLEWENLAEGDRFYQNYRASSITVQGGPAAPAIPIQLEDRPGAQVHLYATQATLEMTITITNTYLPQERNGEMFTELAVGEIRAYGYPSQAVATPGTATTAG